MLIRRYFQTWLSYGSLALSLGLIACSGLSGPTGAGGGVGGGNAVGGDAALSQETAFNPGSVQGGGEGHGQEQKKTPHRVTVSSTDNRTNCGIPFLEAQEIFASEGPMLHASFGSSVTGNFTDEKDVPLSRFGQGGVPECPLLVPTNDGTRRFMSPNAVKVVVTFSDAGKLFQSLPRVISCQPSCEAKPCEVCVDLKELAEIPEADRYVKPVPVETNDGFERIDLGDLPSVEDNDPKAPALLNPNIDFGRQLPTFTPNLGR